MTTSMILVLATVCAAIVLISFFQSRPRMVVIRNPTLGMLDLLGGKAQMEIASDRAALAALFSQVTLSHDSTPRCDVLLIYGDVEADGTIGNSQLGLRELVRDSGAIVAVFATENPGQNYIKACATRNYGVANLVLTLKRNGVAFDQFVYELFSAMKQGTSMPVAWVRLAPQHGPQITNVPETIFACERGQVCFS